MFASFVHCCRYSCTRFLVFFSIYLLQSFSFYIIFYLLKHRNDNREEKAKNYISRHMYMYIYIYVYIFSVIYLLSCTFYMLCYAMPEGMIFCCAVDPRALYMVARAPCTWRMMTAYRVGCSRLLLVISHSGRQVHHLFIFGYLSTGSVREGTSSSPPARRQRDVP